MKMYIFFTIIISSNSISINSIINSITIIISLLYFIISWVETPLFNA